MSKSAPGPVELSITALRLKKYGKQKPVKAPNPRRPAKPKKSP